MLCDVKQLGCFVEQNVSLYTNPNLFGATDSLED